MVRYSFADALWSLNAVLVVGRSLAFAGAPHEELAAIFDAAEVLPLYLLGDADQTEMFRDIVEDLAARFPAMQQALDRLDGGGQRFAR